MLSAPACARSPFFDDDDWIPPPRPSDLYRAASVGSWGVTSIGRGFDWNDTEQRTSEPVVVETVATPRPDAPLDPNTHPRKHQHSFVDNPPITLNPSVIPQLPMQPIQTAFPVTDSPLPSPGATLSRAAYRQTPSTPSSPRPRRRSSQQRVSLIAGRVSIASIEIEPPSPPPSLPHSLRRTDSGLTRPNTTSTSSPLSAASTRAPTPSSENESFLGGRNISEFVIEGEIGRGAYGLVKRGRELFPGGLVGPPLVIKQVIKSRILADCWKKHPLHGTIPIEIYVMSAISNTNYVLPVRRPWDPRRASGNHSPQSPDDDLKENDWVEGSIVKGHPNICPLLDFFEDGHYYYLILPSTTPEQQPNKPSPSTDLFDLVENYPNGLPPNLIRSYLGQIADALAFLHSQGIVHRDIKDENVVLGPNGKCILIDFGSSGLVKKNGWDSFSGTLDYAGPEILRGERYFGKEQDVWAFGVVAYVLLVGECPFMTAAEAQEGFQSPFANAAIALDDRCTEDKEHEGEEEDGGGALGDAAALVRSCLQVDVSARPTFEKILQCRFLAGEGGWGMASC